MDSHNEVAYPYGTVQHLPNTYVTVLRMVNEHGFLANLAVASFAHLVQVIRHGLKKIQDQPRLIPRLPHRDRAEPGARLDGHHELRSVSQY